MVREIRRRKPRPPRARTAHGTWIEPAWGVRRLVEQEKWGVSDAVREIVATCNLHPPAAAFNGVRAAYYEVKKKPWPEPEDES